MPKTSNSGGSNPGQMPQPLPLDVVSIQSQVVYGRVGNSIAVPAIEEYGWQVASVPTVVFSNTPHYPTIHGGALPVEWFDGYLQDLAARGALPHVKAVLVGYLGNRAQAEALRHWIGSLQTHGSRPLCIIDPVLGDSDHGVYVDPSLIHAYRQHLLSLAHGLTPNSFELETLMGQPLRDIESITAAARTLLTGRTEWIVVTSAAAETCPEGEMQVAVVSREREQVIKHPRIPCAPKGTGDLFSAVLTASLLHGTPLLEAAEEACGQVVAAIEHTRRQNCGELLRPPKPSPTTLHTTP